MQPVNRNAGPPGIVSPDDRSLSRALQVIHNAKTSCSRHAESLLASGATDSPELAQLAILWRTLDTQSWEIRRELGLSARGRQPEWVTRALDSSYA